MAKYFRVKRNNRGAILVDHDGNVIDPQRQREIANQIIETVDAPDYVYFGIDHKQKLHKIGRSNDPERRAKEWGIELYHTIECDRFGQYSSSVIESMFLDFYKKIGEHDHGEFFTLDDSDHFLIRQITDAKDAVNVLHACEKAWDYFTNTRQDSIDECFAKLCAIRFNGTFDQVRAALWLMLGFIGGKHTTEQSVVNGIILAVKYKSVANEVFNYNNGKGN